jgi:hypothetical protein
VPRPIAASSRCNKSFHWDPGFENYNNICCLMLLVFSYLNAVTDQQEVYTSSEMRRERDIERESAISGLMGVLGQVFPLSLIYTT